jgi:hypothetical protein
MPRIVIRSFIAGTGSERHMFVVYRSLARKVSVILTNSPEFHEQPDSFAVTLHRAVDSSRAGR